jgi:hypothetical protein
MDITKIRTIWVFRQFEISLERNDPGQMMLGAFWFKNHLFADEPWEAGVSMVWVAIVARGRW